jgi:beta,beta-carotene 9',10'-dioxygenase
MLLTMSTSLSHTTATDHRLGFQSLDEETSVERLPVTGEVPGWLTGALVRVTPALFEVGDRRVAHWFDGLAMLNRFGFAGGEVSYRNRFLDSQAYRDARPGEMGTRADGVREPRIRHSGFATDPCRSIFQRVQSIFSPGFTDNANVNLARIGERHIAMTETPLPIEFDADTLTTVGHLEYADSLKAQITTAHPHHDPERDELVNYVAHFSRTSEYVLYGLPAGSSTRRVIARVPVSRPAYMHAFGMSGRYLILAEYPLRVNPLELALSGKPFIENYKWKPEQGTRFQILDRETGALRGSYETEPFFCFHHVNAFERDSGELVIDLIAYDDAEVISSLYLDREGPRDVLPRTELRRYTIDLDGGRVSWEALPGGENVELPRIDYGRRNTLDYGYAYFAGSGDGSWIDRLVKLDVREGTRSEWSSPGCYPGEPIFVREPGTEAEDAGVVLSVVLDSDAGRSFLLVLDAASFEELARADAPHHIPFGFHGEYVG